MVQPTITGRVVEELKVPRCFVAIYRRETSHDANIKVHVYWGVLKTRGNHQCFDDVAR